MQPGPMFQPLAFDPDTIRLVGAAFDDVCRALAADRRVLAGRLIAGRIVALAHSGERDRARLCSGTLTYFGLTGNDGRQAHIPAKACPGRDPGWTPVRRQEHAPMR